jgi:hypothetical protein
MTVPKIWSRVAQCFVCLVAAANVATAVPGGEPFVLHVSVHGSDAWSGTLAAPNSSRDDGPFRSLERARDAIRDLKRQNRLPDGGAIVEVGGGAHELERPFELSAEDSGTDAAPIVYQARKGSNVRLVGGRMIQEWRPVSDTAVLRMLEPQAVGHVLQTNLHDAGVSDFGELKPGPKWGQSEPGLELFFQTRPMTLARWPNRGFTTIRRVLGPTPVDGGGDNGCREGVFTYDGDRPRRWAGSSDIMLHGFWARDWADQRLRVASIDTDRRIISLEPEPRHEFGFRPAHRYYAYNLLAELDEPCEWFLDRATGMLYFWPPAPVEDEPPVVSLLPHIVTMKGVAHVILRGLTLECCRGTAVRVEDATHTRIVGCTIRNIGGAAVTMSGQESGVVGCDLYHLAGGGITLSGGDRRTLSPGGLFIDNCHLHNFGRWNPINNPGATVSGVGNRITHSLFHDAPHMAVMWSGNDHVFEYNEFHSVVQGSNDAGIMYAGFDPTTRGHLIRYNYFHDVYGLEGRGCNGVYLDDMFCSATIFGNVFCKVPRAAFIGGGHDNIVENNIFIDCRPAVHVDARMLGWAGTDQNRKTMKDRLAAVPYTDEPWRSRYPRLVTYLDNDFAEPKNNLVARNICVGGLWAEVEPRARPGVRFQDNLTDQDPCFVDAAHHDFRMLASSPAWQLGFQPIPFKKIGPYASDDRASWPIHHTTQPPPRLKLDVSANSLRYLLARLQLPTGWLTACGFLALAVWGGLHCCSPSRCSAIFKLVLIVMRITLGFIAMAAILAVCSTWVVLPSRRLLWPALIALSTVIEVAILIASNAVNRASR